jgi:hypothetical protein
MEMQFKSIADVKIAVTQNGNASLAGAQVIKVTGQSQVLLGSTDSNGIFNIAGLVEGSYTYLLKTAEGLSQQLNIVVDAASDGATIYKTVDFITQFEKFGKIAFTGERHLYSVNVKQGDTLAISVHGAIVDGIAAAYNVQADVYSTDKVLTASGYGYGSAFNFSQYNSFADLKNITIVADGNFTVAIQPYYANNLGGYFLSASINGQPAEIKSYQDGGSVQGTIYRVDGITPLANEIVDISTQDVLGLHIRTTSDVGGHYQFDNVPLADLTLSLIEAEQVLVSATDKLETPAQVLVRDLKVPQKTTLQVSITLPDDAVIPYSMNFSFTDIKGVHVVGPVYFAGTRTSTSFTTVALGDTITVSAIHPQNANINVTQVVNGSDGQTIAVNLLLESAKISGTVSNADGSPTPYSLVTAYRTIDHTYITSTYSDNLGAYVLTALPVGQDLIIAAQNTNNQVNSTININLSGGQILTGQDIKLVATGTIEGYVQMSNGAPITGANIVISGTANGAGFTMPSVSSDDTGYFSVNFVPVGFNVEVAATASDLLGTKSQSTIVNSPDELVTLPPFVFTSGATLQVNVFDGNHQIDPIIFDGVNSECGPNRIYLTTSDGNEIYREANGFGFAPITDLPEGMVTVKYYATCDRPEWGGTPLATQSVSVSGNQQFQLDLLVPIVKVKVTLTGGIPPEYNYVSITYTAPDGSTITRQPSYTTEGRSIWHYLVGVTPGNFTIDANAYFQGQSFNVSQSGTMVGTSNVDVEVVIPYSYSGPAIIRGNVILPDGATVPYANLTLYQNGNTQFGNSDWYGLYQFNTPLLGPFELTAQDANTGVSVTAKGTVIDGQVNVVNLVFPPAGSVTGTLYDVDGNTVPWADIYVYSSGAPGIELYAQTDDQGLYRIDNVVTGVIKVEGWDPASQFAAVATGVLKTNLETITVDLNETVAGPGQISGVVKQSDGSPVAWAEVTINQQGVLYTISADEFGNYLYDSPLPGAFQITAKETSTGLTVSANDNVTAGLTTTIDLVIPVSGSVTGILYDVNGAVIPYGAIDITSSGATGWTLRTTTDATGLYRFDNVPIGNFALAGFNPATQRVISGTGSLSVKNELITIDLHESPIVPGQVAGTVKFGDGTPAVSADVWLEQAGVTHYTITDQAGHYLFVNMPPGAFQINALDNNNTGATGSASGVVFEGSLSTVDISLSAFGSVTGTLYDLNSLPVANANVEVTTTGDVSLVFHAVTDASGAYQINQVPLGLISAVAVNPLSQNKVFATGYLEWNGDITTVDMWERLGITGQISGKVKYSDGQVVQWPSVSLFQNGQTTYATTDIAGNYLFSPIVPGPVEITAQDGNSGLTTIVKTSLQENVNATFDFNLPASGSVMGTLYDVNGTPILNSEVDIYSSGTPGFNLYVNTDAQGNYRVDHVALGDISVVGWNNSTQMAVMGNGKLIADMQTITVDLHETAGGIVSGHMFADASGNTVANATVVLYTKDSFGPVGQLSQWVTTDTSGAFSFTSAPAGDFRLYALDPVNQENVGISDGTAIMNAVITLDVTLGNGVGLPYVLIGSDGYRFKVDCDGSLWRETAPYSNEMYALKVNTSNMPCVPGALVSSDKRELSFGPSKIGPVQVSRRVFSPATGGFVRFIDSYVNPGIVDTSINLQVGGAYLGYYAPLLSDPINNNQTYAVLGETVDVPAIAEVFGGTGSTNPAGTYIYKPIGDVSTGIPNYWSMETSYNWSFNMSAGQRISLLHYYSQAINGPAAQALGQSLSTYAAPSMFDGMTKIDFPSIYNFPNANY